MSDAAVHREVRRGSIALFPVQAQDLGWVLAQFAIPEIWLNFGGDEPSAHHALSSYLLTRVVPFVVHAVEDQRRIGFGVLFGPKEEPGTWELGYAITDPKDRNAFRAIHTVDALCHYAFEHRQATGIRWRIRGENRAAEAIVRRLGYAPCEGAPTDDALFRQYHGSPEAWAARRARLVREGRAETSAAGSGAAPFACRVLSGLEIFPCFDVLNRSLPDPGCA